jgi:hypothetical protein
MTHGWVSRPDPPTISDHFSAKTPICQTKNRKQTPNPFFCNQQTQPVSWIYKPIRKKQENKTHQSRPTVALAPWVCNPCLLASLLFFSSFSSFSSFSFLPYLDKNQV